MKTLLLSLVCILFSVQAFTQAFSIDNSFNPNFSFHDGLEAFGLSSIIQIDNNDLIVSGYFYFQKNNKHYGDLVRISQYGILDESFNHIPVQYTIVKMFDRHDSLYAIQARSRHFSGFNGQMVEPIIRLNPHDHVGIEEQEMEQGLLIYPNPGQDEIIIQHSRIIKTIKIYTMAGVFVRKKPANTKRLSIDISTLPPGYYILQISNECDVVARKFLKVR